MVELRYSGPHHPDSIKAFTSFSEWDSTEHKPREAQEAIATAGTLKMEMEDTMRKPEKDVKYIQNLVDSKEFQEIEKN